MPSYPLFGVVLQSEVALSTLQAGAAADSTATIRICRQTESVVTAKAAASDNPPLHDDWQLQYVLRFAEFNDKPFMSVFEGARGYLLRVHQRADFEVSPGGDSIMCRSHIGVPWATVEQLLVDQIVPRALQLCGRPSLHASAVSQGDAVLALVGPAGAGKSTTTAALCQRGWSLVCDDCLALEIADGHIVVHPGYPSVRLWPDSANALLGDDHQLPLASPRTDKRRKAYPLDTRTRKLACIILLDPYEGKHITVKQLRARDAFALLTTTLHRLTPQGSRVLDAEFQLLSAIASSVPLLRLRYRQVFDGQDALLDQIQQAFANVSNIA